jgi:hypothetical protein
MKFRKSRGRQTIWLHMVAVDEHADEIDGASGGEFPIGWEMGIVDGDVVRVAFDTEILGARDNYLRQPVNRFNRGRAHRRSTALVKSHLPEAHYQALFL